MNQIPSQNDLVFRLSGGRRDGERVAVTSTKCLLPTGSQDDASGAHLVVYRGAQGVAVYSPSESLSVNGVESSVHWLKTGDRIRLHDSMEAVVEQLGMIIDHSLAEDSGCDLETESGAAQSEWDAVAAPVADVAEAALNDLEAEVDAADLPLIPAAPLVESSTLTPEPTPEPIVCAEPQPESQPENSWPSPVVLEESSPAAEAPAYYSHGQDGNEEQILCDVPESTVAQPEPMATAAGPAVTEDQVPVHPVAADAGAEAFPPENEAVNELTNHVTHSSLVDGLSFPESKVNIPVPAVEPTAAPLPESSDILGSGLEGLGSRLVDELLRERELEGNATAAEPNADEVEAVTEEAAVDAAPAPKESVGELLARMKAEGQWQGLPDQEPAERPRATVISEPMVVNTQPSLEDQAAAVLSTESRGEDEDLDDYMSRLLTRMNGGKQAAKPKPVTQNPSREKPADQRPPVQGGIVEFVPPANPLTPDEFVPKQKAEPPKSLNAMRELANVSARTAVMLSARSQRKALATLQLAIGVCSFVMSLYYFLIGSSQFGDSNFLLGLVCLAVSGVLAYRYYHTMLRNEVLAAAENRAIWPTGVPVEDDQPAALLPENESESPAAQPALPQPEQAAD